MKQVILYGFAPSTYTRTARILCNVKGVPHELTPLDFGSESHRALHPFAKMPILEHGKNVVYETLAIGAYLDAKFDGPSLQPGEPMARVRMLQWASAIEDYLYRDVVGELVKAMQGKQDVPKAALDKARQDLKVLDDALAKQAFCCGDEPCLADYLWLPIIDFAQAAPVGTRLLDGFRHLARSAAGLRESKAVATTAT